MNRLDIPDLRLRALLGFERWQSALTKASTGDHLGSIDGVEANRMEVVFDRISHLVLGQPLGLFKP